MKTSNCLKTMLKINSRTSSDSDDGKDLCPFCDEEMPPNPSSKLLKMKAELLLLPNITKGIGRPGAMSLPWLQRASFCGLHDAEREVIPHGLTQGWPTSIDFKKLERVSFKLAFEDHPA
ncbi:uncharacterized protein MELLADRAFT_87717 [Melampsora larici-populina 98AG31]|uniref:Uncharacterized protein n=1 Tax=Melampsora larici-populina (strain 98AG31 / pathotype 3-4-7) TaxID=747676 RepID=F4RNU1_MELLP|nr:uncharacterized protein MELLADRAFT_87717 [Melampsora larici-populina 98AG31]EGG05804.1 hypothetical protein MELLADRAFT_87717 [Melampsora larici-populina 98AG31]